MEGHPYAMRFTSDENVVVADMYQNRSTSRDTLSNLKAKDNKNSSSLRTVYNERKKLLEKECGGESPMNVLFNQLIGKKFIHHDRTNPATNALEDLFFIHPTSYMIYRAFPHVLIIDTKYNTNVYKLPLVQIVGVTSTGKTFTIALAFISHEKEDNFTWLLTMLKTTLDTCMLPRVIVIDRDLALMKTCQIVFPDATKLLCRFHISRNILKNCRQSFALIEEWELFEQLWNSLIHSATPTKYKKRYTKLYDTLVHSHQRVLQYLHRNWLDNYKEKFVSVWIDQNLHFGNTTTNRVEGAHALLKKHLLTHNSPIDKFVDVVVRIVTRQQGAIKETFEQSSKKTINHHNVPLFNELRRHVSHDALELLCEELVRIDRLQQYGSECGCRIHTSCGLPCVCILSKYLNSGQAIPVESIDIFWKKLDFDPLYVESDEDIESRVYEAVEVFKEKFNKESKGGKKVCCRSRYHS
ncbi:PKS-NRPS hybrid synthetase cheA-like [Bidens hawaiensis]|uniref:PKS-NRPS hybrid synthetase cheA-like n=1 Tax=Bidens hawaiensis TaxID=980011 RepID=UPI00404B52BC